MIRPWVPGRGRSGPALPKGSKNMVRFIISSSGVSGQQRRFSNRPTATLISRIMPVRQRRRPSQELNFPFGIHTALTPPHLCHYLLAELISSSKAVGDMAQQLKPLLRAPLRNAPCPQISFKMLRNPSSAAVPLTRLSTWMLSSPDVSRRLPASTHCSIQLHRQPTWAGPPSKV